MMNKYKKFINESKEEDDVYISRLKDLVDLALPLLNEAKILYAENSKWKRANEIKRQLNDYWIKIFKFNIDDKPKPKPKEAKRNSTADLIVGNKYIYEPDKDTYGKYRTMNDKQVVLMDINRKIRTMSDTIDSFNKARCNYLISIIGAGRNGINKFWTRRECLKHIPYKK